MQGLLYRFGCKEKEKWRKLHGKKLRKFWIDQRLKAPEALINQSEHKLTIFEEQALPCGLNHSILPPSCDSITIQTAFEKLSRHASSKLQQTHKAPFANSLRYLSHSYMFSFSGACNSVSNKFLHKTLRQLRHNANIKVCRFDKGNGTVLMNSVDYFEKLGSIILSNKFVEVPTAENHLHPPSLKNRKYQFNIT